MILRRMRPLGSKPSRHSLLSPFWCDFKSFLGKFHPMASLRLGSNQPTKHGETRFDCVGADLRGVYLVGSKYGNLGETSRLMFVSEQRGLSI